jgi:hypothetical protein
LTLGILGEYLGQVLEETKARPLYLVAEAQVPSLAAKRALNQDLTTPPPPR